MTLRNLLSRFHLSILERALILLVSGFLVGFEVATLKSDRDWLSLGAILAVGLVSFAAQTWALLGECERMGNRRVEAVIWEARRGLALELGAAFEFEKANGRSPFDPVVVQVTPTESLTIRTSRVTLADPAELLRATAPKRPPRPN